MKKQQKLKQEKPVKKKQPLTFDERFKDKMNHVGKLGVLDLLGLHQPFNLDRAPTPIIQPIIEAPEVDKNPQKQAMPKRKLSYNQHSKLSSKDAKLRTNKTDVVKNRQKDGDKSQKLGLPRISKSSANIALDIDAKEMSTKQYWRGKTKTPIIKKRANSQLSCLNIIKVDYDANAHFENLAKFQKLNKNHKKSIKIERL